MTCAGGLNPTLTVHAARIPLTPLKKDDIMNMTFHESYGDLPKSTLRLIKKYNVSPADYDGLLNELSLVWSDDIADCEWRELELTIVSHSETGMYRPEFF